LKNRSERKRRVRTAVLLSIPTLWLGVWGCSGAETDGLSSGNASGSDAGAPQTEPPTGTGAPDAQSPLHGDGSSPPPAGDGAAAANDATSADTMTFDATSGDDATSPSADATVDDGGGKSEASSPDVADAGPGPSSPSDPCPDPSNTFLDCDPKCQPDTPDACATATCGPAVPFLGEFFRADQVFRPRESPGTDPQCVIRCGDGGVVYGYAFEFSPGLNSTFEINVEKPWLYVPASATSFCTAPRPAVDTCYTVNPLKPYYDNLFYIVTDDPNAPAVNITIGTPLTYTPCSLN
jgi:hypothetical protein